MKRKKESLPLQENDENNDFTYHARFGPGLLRYDNHYRSSHPKSPGRLFTKASRLVPDQSYTVRELMERAVVNALPSVQRQGFYDDEQDITRLFAKSGIDLSTLDLVELQMYREELNDYINQLQKPPATTEEVQNEQNEAQE